MKEPHIVDQWYLSYCCRLHRHAMWYFSEKFIVGLS